ncbi:probable glutamate receptor [Scylla paramamosain]|uniref:probable glutamate receptor n=1 Tax=Scylla paramamosain TaxID=85552 RepID=UPI003082E200
MAADRPHIKIAAGEWVPYTKIERDASGSITILGPMVELLRIFSTLLNFDYELLPAPGNLWGGPLANGTWTGMLGMLHRQEAELAIAPFFVTPQRESVCDFSVTVFSDYQAILMQRPKLQSDVAGFIKPFTVEVWLLILASFLAISSTVAWVSGSEAALFQTPLTRPWARSVLMALQTVSQETSEWVPPHDAGRMLVTTWLLASLVFMSSYSGILTAMLTVPRVTIPIDSLADLVAQDDLPWRLEAGSMMYSFFEESEDPIGRKVFLEKAGTFQDCWAARQDVASGEFAAICDRTTMMKAMSWDFSTTGNCHLYMSQQKVYSSGILSIGFKTKSKYLPPANKILLVLKEAGLLDKWLGEQITNTTQCLRPPSADSREGVSPLSVTAFSGPLACLGLGLTLAVVVFLMEMMIGVSRKK